MAVIPLIQAMVSTWWTFLLAMLKKYHGLGAAHGRYIQVLIDVYVYVEIGTTKSQSPSASDSLVDDFPTVSGHGCFKFDISIRQDVQPSLFKRRRAISWELHQWCSNAKSHVLSDCFHMLKNISPDVSNARAKRMWLDSLDRLIQPFACGSGL